MSVYAVRLISFAGWLRTVLQTKEEMAIAGFFTREKAVKHMLPSCTVR